MTLKQNKRQKKVCINCQELYDPDERFRVYGDGLVGSGCCSAQCYTKEKVKEKTNMSLGRMAREKILEQINQERLRQEGLWADKFDDKNTSNDWITFCVRYLGRAIAAEDSDLEAFTKNLLKVAALCVAAIESVCRNGGLPPRHYDE